MFSRVTVLLLVCVLFQLSFSAEQSISRATPSTSIFNFNNGFGKLNFGAGLNFNSNKNPSGAAQRSDKVADRLPQRSYDDRSDSFKHQAFNFVKDARDECVNCFNLIANSENNYERLGNTVDILYKHRTLIGVGAAGIVLRKAIGDRR